MGLKLFLDKADWLSRLLESVYPFVFIDSTFLKMRRENRVRNVAVYVVVGINPKGYKELLELLGERSE